MMCAIISNTDCNEIFGIITAVIRISDMTTERRLGESGRGQAKPIEATYFIFEWDFANLGQEGLRAFAICICRDSSVGRASD